eukprot:GHVR01058922.1.p1 GENE.GHVR01058922.1~~GHVR01058922.1.p1  ORF type:complete len:346 (+),score=22.26 GHVR01058922.1:39-1076(+)
MPNIRLFLLWLLLGSQFRSSRHLLLSGSNLYSIRQKTKENVLDIVLKDYIDESTQFPKGFKFAKQTADKLSDENIEGVSEYDKAMVLCRTLINKTEEDVQTSWVVNLLQNFFWNKKFIKSLIEKRGGLSDLLSKRFFRFDKWSWLQSLASLLISAKHHEYSAQVNGLTKEAIDITSFIIKPIFDWIFSIKNIKKENIIRIVAPHSLGSKYYYLFKLWSVNLFCYPYSSNLCDKSYLNSMMNSISNTHSHLFLLDTHNEDYLYEAGGARNYPLWYVMDLLFSVRDKHLIDDTSLDKDKIILLCRQLYMSNLVHSFFVLSYKLYNNEATLYVPLMKQLLIHTSSLCL